MNRRIKKSKCATCGCDLYTGESVKVVYRIEYMKTYVIGDRIIKEPSSTERNVNLCRKCAAPLMGSHDVDLYSTVSEYERNGIARG